MAVVASVSDHPRPPLLDALHGWITTVDHKRIGILYILTSPALSRHRRH